MFITKASPVVLLSSYYVFSKCFYFLVSDISLLLFHFFGFKSVTGEQIQGTGNSKEKEKEKRIGKKPDTEMRNHKVRTTTKALGAMMDSSSWRLIQHYLRHHHCPEKDAHSGRRRFHWTQNFLIKQRQSLSR